ncbi:uncharacterized protein LOC143614113 [Bidens hawaiensis]|uniref:uncharacterized protein LOC143614113 n=1 Tax=Bidens hawaiensis TaxID=980011 RepID=UPI00404A3138
MAGIVINPVHILPVADIVDRLLDYVRSGTRDDKKICRLCLHLSRAIDHAVRNNEIPHRALELPVLLKEVRQWTGDENILTAIMMVMISIKGACRNGWFREKDNEELHTLWTEIATSFCSVKDMNSGENTVKNSIATVLSRFFPRMKMGEIFTFIEAPPGHGAFVRDFHIAKNVKSPDEEVYLFVAQTDNTETSSCITSPQLVSFLLNGKAVDRRTGIYKDPGPQIPTDITDLVRYGTTNLLQAVGQFNGKYIIVVAFMSMITNPSCPELPDYTQPATVASDLDNDIVEGPSTISLTCPISFKRIVTPVKGHLCNHLQCFDFENYVDMNSRRPSWRCPHCSQSVCFTDIRVDKKMAKVLKEVSDTISHVKITADGSWKHVNECDDHADEQDKPLLHQESNPSLDKGEDIMDLTKGGNDIDAHQENEEKPSLAQLQNQLNLCGRIPSLLNMNPVHTNTSPHMENPFSRQTHEIRTSDTISNVAVSQGQTYISSSHNMQLPIHGIWRSVNPNLQGQSQSQTECQIPASGMQFQQNSMNNMSNDYGQRYTTPGAYVTRIPVSVQVPPTQTPAGMDRQQQFSGSFTDQHQIIRMIAASNPSMFENMGLQNWINHGHSNVSSQPAQQFGAHSGPSHQSTGQPINSYRYQSANHMVESNHVGPTIAQVVNQQGHHHVCSVSNRQALCYVGPTTGSISNQQAQHYVGPTTASISNQQALRYVSPTNGSISNQQAHHYTNATAPQASQINDWTPPTPALIPNSYSSMPVISLEGVGQAFRMQEGSVNAPADQIWRPVSRMRGSLGDRAYSDAFSQSIIYPTQPVQADVSPPALSTPRPFIPAHLQAILANNRNANGLPEGADGSVLDGMVVPGN